MAWGAFLSSETLTVDGDFEAYQVAGGGAAVVIQLGPLETAVLNFNIASVVGEVDDLEIQILQGTRISSGNTYDAAGATTTVDIDTAADTQPDDYYIGMYHRPTTGGEIADVRLITDYDGTTNDRLTLDHAMVGSPSSGEGYEIFQMHGISFIITAETVPIDADPQNAKITVNGQAGEFVIARAKRTGTTDAHKTVMTYQLNGVSV